MWDSANLDRSPQGSIETWGIDEGPKDDTSSAVVSHIWPKTGQIWGTRGPFARGKFQGRFLHTFHGERGTPFVSTPPLFSSAEAPRVQVFPMRCNLYCIGSSQLPSVFRLNTPGDLNAPFACDAQHDTCSADGLCWLYGLLSCCQNADSRSRRRYRPCPDLRKTDRDLCRWLLLGLSLIHI